MAVGAEPSGMPAWLYQALSSDALGERLGKCYWRCASVAILGVTERRTAAGGHKRGARGVAPQSRFRARGLITEEAPWTQVLAARRCERLA